MHSMPIPYSKPSYPSLSNPIGPTQPHPILSYPILSYPIPSQSKKTLRDLDLAATDDPDADAAGDREGDTEVEKRRSSAPPSRIIEKDRAKGVVKSTLKVKQREKEVEKNVVGLVKVTSDGSIYDVSSFHSSTESADRLRTRSGPGTGTGTQKRRSSTAGALSTSTSSSIHTLKDLGVGAAFCPGVREDESGEGLIENTETWRDTGTRRKA
jgi:hypothetical protein